MYVQDNFYSGKSSSAKEVSTTPSSNSLINTISNLADINQNNYQYSAEQQMNFNSNEAQKNRDWQERMSNTAYQRAVNDLREAGLNPVLAVGNSGAATTSGSTASASMANVDTSKTAATIALMQSLINAQSAANVASIYANATKYASDNSLSASKYASDNSLTASRYSSDNSVYNNPSFSGLTKQLMNSLEGYASEISGQDYTKYYSQKGTGSWAYKH